MNVYIVTEGEYSDERIKGVFANKEKATVYQKLCPNANDWIQEYTLLDDKVCIPVRYIEVIYFLYDVPSYAESRFDFQIIISNSIDEKPKALKSSDYYSHKFPYIEFTREITSNNYDEESLRSKYIKVCEDVKAEIESLKEIEGWDDEMIKEWFHNKQTIIPDNE